MMTSCKNDYKTINKKLISHMKCDALKQEADRRFSCTSSTDCQLLIEGVSNEQQKKGEGEGIRAQGRQCEIDSSEITQLNCTLCVWDSVRFGFLSFFFFALFLWPDNAL